MKISFECECCMLQKTLLLFCQDFVASHKECDFVVSDRRITTQKPLFLVGLHILEPFDKKTLFSALEEFYSAIQLRPSNHGVQNLQPLQSENFDTFEVRLDQILANFKNELLMLVKGAK